MGSTKSSDVETRNPASGAVITRYAVDGPEQIERLVRQAQDGFQTWRNRSVEDRAALFGCLSQTLEAETEHLARLITTEMGKPIVEARAEVKKCAYIAAWFAEHGPALLADEPALVKDSTVYVSYLPIGIVLGIMPWNFPLWQAMRAIVPIVIGGNAFLLKHAPNVLGCAYALQDVFERSGFPQGVITNVNIGNEGVDKLLHDPRVVAVTLTGSVGAGAAVASIAGKLVKKSLLELGGSDPFIVLADADLDQAAAVGVEARFENAGQICLAAKRFIVEAPVAEAFTRRFVEATRQLVMGDPMDEATNIGPIARADLRDGLHKQVEATSARGAELLLGGQAVGGPGFFYQPTVFGGVRPGMAAFDEETFGPVAAIVVADDAEHAIGLANASEFGLSSSLWTRDLGRARQIARRLETGGVFINGHSASDPRVPVGGIKKSGYGRELSHFGLREFVNVQTVWIKS